LIDLGFGGLGSTALGAANVENDLVWEALNFKG